MKEGISIREFARREGVSDTLVRKALKLNRLAAFEDGSIDPKLAGSSWREGNAKGANSANPNANPAVRSSHSAVRTTNPRYRRRGALGRPALTRVGQTRPPQELPNKHYPERLSGSGNMPYIGRLTHSYSTDRL